MTRGWGCEYSLFSQSVRAEKGETLGNNVRGVQRRDTS